MLAIRDLSASGMSTPPRPPARTEATALTARGMIVSLPSTTVAIGSLKSPVDCGDSACHRKPSPYFCHDGLSPLIPARSPRAFFAAPPSQAVSGAAIGMLDQPPPLTARS